MLPSDPAHPPTALLLHRYVVARVIWADMLSIAVTYFITLCLFPGLESEIRHCVLGEWLPILVMAVFNLSDFVGKVGFLPALPLVARAHPGRSPGRGCIRVPGRSVAAMQRQGPHSTPPGRPLPGPARWFRVPAASPRSLCPVFLLRGH